VVIDYVYYIFDILNLGLNHKNKNIRDLFRASVALSRVTSIEYYMVKDVKGDLVAYSHSMLARWRHHFSQLLCVHGVNDGRQNRKFLR
jgi:hypothetical protein